MSRQRLIRRWGGFVPSSSLALWFLTTLVAKAEDSWTRGIGGGIFGVADIKVEAFELNTVSKDGRTGHMSGTCIYDNRSPALVALKGTETSYGDFYPNVINQVGNDKNGEWKTIRRPAVHGKAKTLTVPVKTSSKLLTVDLDAFVPTIGKFKYGRLLLKNGESAIFELNYLRLPRSGN
jgi:hypothetical protein